SPYPGYRMYVNDSNEALHFLVDHGAVSDTAASSTTGLNDGKWHHAVGVYQPSRMDVYVDGVLEGSDTSIQAGDFSHTGNLGIGSNGAGTSRFLDGLIDDVRIYNYALTQAQVAWEFNRGAPVGWWRLDECSGTTANDASGKGNNGTITIGGSGSNTSAGTCSSGTGTEAWNNGTTGKRNASLDFDGTDDYVPITGSPTPESNLTIAMWAKPENVGESAGTGDVLYHWGVTSGCGPSSQMLYVKNSKLTFRIGCGTELSSNSTLTNGTWYHFVVTIDSSGVTTLYIDGLQETTPTDTRSGVSVSTGNDKIGAVHDGGTIKNFFDGQLDDVKVFNYTLTQQQIRDNYNAGAVRFGP
ncbi:LamG domain-containing protein, partial [Patescibacteria group bacterium]|nr:LamG domain-containing protein [Patescibacteria group bacterium]